MRILVVTNLYPPHHIGGYELGCRDVVEALRTRGHHVEVLTSTFRQGADLGSEQGVHRQLYFRAADTDRKHHKLRECEILRGVISRLNPDIIYFWNQAGLSHWLPLTARWMGRRTAFFLSDTHFVSWRVGAFLKRLCSAPETSSPAPLVRRAFGDTFLIRGWPVVQDQLCHFASRFLKACAEKDDITVSPESIVSHWGIEVSAFASPSPERLRWPIRRLLYVGQLIPEKGVRTAIEALAQLASTDATCELTLTIAGGGMHSDFEAELRALPQRLGIQERVQFAGKVPRSELPAIYAAHDALVFPSEWDEPFAITPLEAIASDLVVIGTNTGGSGELLRDRETALIYRAGDPADCARAIRELRADQKLCQSIRERARGELVTHHTLASMVDAIESSLWAAVGASTKSRA